MHYYYNQISKSNYELLINQSSNCYIIYLLGVLTKQYTTKITAQILTEYLQNYLFGTKIILLNSL